MLSNFLKIMKERDIEEALQTLKDGPWGADEEIFLQDPDMADLLLNLLDVD